MNLSFSSQCKYLNTNILGQVKQKETWEGIMGCLSVEDCSPMNWNHCAVKCLKLLTSLFSDRVLYDLTWHQVTFLSGAKVGYQPLVAVEFVFGNGLTWETSFLCSGRCWPAVVGCWLVFYPVFALKKSLLCFFIPLENDYLA